MIRILFLIPVVITVVGLNAQIKRTETFKISIPNHLNEFFFNAYPDIDSVKVNFRQKDVADVSLYFKAGFSKENEYYDLCFEGDKYLFTFKYRQPPKLYIPILYTEYIDVVKGCVTRYKISLTIYRDSLNYTIDKFCCALDVSEKEFYSLNRRFSARYNGDISQLEKSIERELVSHVSNTPTTDSIFLFRGIINNYGILSNVELVTGKTTKMSELIKKEIEKKAKMWIPEIQGGRNVKSYIKIFVRQNDNGTFTVLIPPGR